MKHKKSISGSKIKDLMYADLKRYGEVDMRSFLIAYFTNPGYKYVFYMRLSKYFKLRHYKFKYGIEIPYCCNIGKGFCIGHFGTIVISGETTIGENCYILQGVTIGRGGRDGGSPVIGNNVDIYAGAKIIGNVKIGNNVRIGANAVVVKDIPDNSVVGAPLCNLIYMRNAKDVEDTK